MLEYSHVLFLQLYVPTSCKHTLEKAKVKEGLKAVKRWLVTLQGLKDPDVALL
jgi:hypothetical protein